MATTLNIEMRPRGFDEVIGLEKQVAEIRARIESERVPRAWMLSGPFGCGKTTLAYIIAKAVQGWDFVGTPSTQEINAANVTGVDAMRRIAEGAATYPMVGKYNVIILDEAQKLSKSAKDLLLKEFESPSAPTVWIVCTTNPEKFNDGILSRVAHIVVAGMGPAERRTLVERAAAAVSYTGDTSAFLTALTESGIKAPRKVLVSFESFIASGDATRAVQGAQFTEEALPEYFDIAMGTVFGQWNSAYSLPWIKDTNGTPRQFPPVAEQVKALEDSLSKKQKEDSDSPAVAETPKPETSEAADAVAVSEGTHEGKPEAARGVLAVVAATLKSQMYLNAKGLPKGKADKAAECLRQLVTALPSDPSMAACAYPCMVAMLYKINRFMNTASK